MAADSTATGVVACAAYAGGCRVADVPLDEIDQVIRHQDGFIWLGLYEPDEELLRTVQRQFGLHDLAIEDAHLAHQRPKLEQYQDSLFVVIRTAQLTSSDGSEGQRRIEFGETHVFVGRRYLVTVRHGSHRSHVELRARCEATPPLLAQGPGFILYALMDFLIGEYFPIVAAFEEDVEQLEEDLFGEISNGVGRDTVAHIYRLKRELLALKRAVAPVVDVCNRLMRYDLELIPGETRPYFRDVYDHAIRINEMVDNLRELLTTAFEVHLSLISVELNQELKQLAVSSAEENQTTRRLAAWAAIIAVPTMIAGVYGMNFQLTPSNNWEGGFWWAIGSMVAIALALAGWFVKIDWL